MNVKSTGPTVGLNDLDRSRLNPTNSSLIPTATSTAAQEVFENPPAVATTVIKGQATKSTAPKHFIPIANSTTAQVRPLPQLRTNSNNGISSLRARFEGQPGQALEETRKPETPRVKVTISSDVLNVLSSAPKTPSPKTAKVAAQSQSTTTSVNASYNDRKVPRTPGKLNIAKGQGLSLLEQIAAARAKTAVSEEKTNVKAAKPLSACAKVVIAVAAVITVNVLIIILKQNFLK